MCSASASGASAWFLAFLRGIETQLPPDLVTAIAWFLAFLRGIETAASSGHPAGIHCF